MQTGPETNKQMTGPDVRDRFRERLDQQEREARQKRETDNRAPIVQHRALTGPQERKEHA